MYDQGNLVSLFTMLGALEKILRYTKDIDSGEELYSTQDQLVFNACYALLLTIGEESKKLDDAIRTENQQLPWRELKGLRNTLAHEYRRVNQEIVFNIIKEELPTLRGELVRIIGKTDVSTSMLERILKTKYYAHLKYLFANE